MIHARSALVGMLLAAMAPALSAYAQDKAAPGHWPQWRGANRDNVSTETGLLKEWPQGGPNLLWKTQGLGEGVGGVAVAGGLIFLMGYRDDQEFLTALDGDGKALWSVPIGPAVKEAPLMRWLSQRTPTVDDLRVYAVTAGGVLWCLSSREGRALWNRDYTAEFGGVPGPFGGFCDFPLVDGDKLICTPGGPKATLVGLNKSTGAQLWACAVPECKRSTFSTVIACRTGGENAYVHQLDAGTVGVSPETGRRLWFHPFSSLSNRNVHAAIPWKGDTILALAGERKGCALLEFARAAEGMEIKVRYTESHSFDNYFCTSVKFGDHLYSFEDRTTCMDLESGKIVLREPTGVGRPTVTFADGLFYVRGSNGEVHLTEVGPQGMRKVSRFAGPKGKEPAWTFPVVAGGRLYLRDHDALSCYDVRGPEYKEPSLPWNILARKPSNSSPPPAGDPPTAQSRVPAPGHWPQWRGPNRDNVSTETGLLKAWPEGGPSLLWKGHGLGEGITTPVVAGGLVFTLGFREDKEFVTALDGAGKYVWSVPIGPSSREMTGMRYVTQRTPTVDDDRLYALSVKGVLHCMNSADGSVVWTKDYVSGFGGSAGGWGIGDFPLIDGPRVVCAPGGAQGTLVALDKKSGALVWRSRDLKDRAPHSAIVPTEIGKIRQFVVLTYGSVAGIDAKDGALLWRVERNGRTAVVPTPVVKDGTVFVTSGFGQGCNVLQITFDEGRFKPVELYSGTHMENHHGGVVGVANHLYGTDNSGLMCVELASGGLAWKNRCVGKGSLVYADGRLVMRGEGGGVALVEATPQGFRQTGRFNAERSRDPAWSHPVIAGGRLYLREQDFLLCYDLRGPEYKPPPPVWDILSKAKPGVPPKPAPPIREEPARRSSAAFVPTPNDVVGKMLEAAKVIREDVLVDLGSGDGRIPIAASKQYGCRSVGYEIDAALVRLSRTRASDSGVQELVTIEEKDLFTADLSGATVVTLYLGEKNNERLLPQLLKLRPGARIVSHQHLLGATSPKPEKEIQVTSSEDGADHTIYLWTAPLKMPPADK